MKVRSLKKVAMKSIRERHVAKFAQQAATHAVKKALMCNVSVTVARGSKIYRLYPSGLEEFVGILPPQVKVRKSIIKLTS